MRAGPGERSADLRRGQVRTAFPALGLESVEPRFIKRYKLEGFRWGKLPGPH